MATRLDVITLALRRLGVVAKDETPDADDEATVGAVLDSLFAEVQAAYVTTWTSATVPDAAFRPMANYLAVEIAQDYGYPPPERRKTAWARLMAQVRPNTIPDPRDLDDDDTISDEEVDAGDRARYY
jgi:hypothetical protein